MRRIASLLLLMVPCGSAIASDCALGSPDIIRLVDWEVSTSPNAADPAALELTLVYENVAEKAFVDISALVNVGDSEGRHIVTLGISSDAALAPGEQTEETVTHTGTDLGKIVSMDHDDVVITLCTNFVEYADGSGTIFD